MKNVQIGSAEESDAGSFIELQSVTYRQAYLGAHSSENIEAYCLKHFTIDSARKNLANKNTICCVGRLDNKVAGFYMVKHHSCPVELEGKSSELKQIYVLREAYGSGLGLALYEHAMASVRASGSCQVWLCVADSNYRARSFYSKLGFQAVGEGPVLEVGSDRLSSTIMVRGV